MWLGFYYPVHSNLFLLLLSGEGVFKCVGSL